MVRSVPAVKDRRGPGDSAGPGRYNTVMEERSRRIEAESALIVRHGPRCRPSDCPPGLFVMAGRFYVAVRTADGLDAHELATGERIARELLVCAMVEPLTLRQVVYTERREV